MGHTGSNHLPMESEPRDSASWCALRPSAPNSLTDELAWISASMQRKDGPAGLPAAAHATSRGVRPLPASLKK